MNQPDPRGDASSEASTAAARAWLLLAVGALVLAGLLATLLVVGRVPGLSALFTDPLFFRRCLVAHVDLSLVVWLYAFVAALSFALPGRRSPLALRAHHLGTAAIAVLLATTLFSSAQPVLANYVPMLDHPAYGVGMALFGVAVVGAAVDRRLLRPQGGPGGGAGVLALGAATRVGLQATAAALVLAALTFACSFATRPLGTSTDVTYELMLWGGGHVLQLVSTAAMLTVWLLLLERSLGAAPISGGSARALFGALLLPWVVAPALALTGTTTSAYHTGFTDLMRYGLFPIVVAVLGLSLAALRRVGALRLAALQDGRLLAFYVSAGLAVLGFVLGALIRGSTTMIPAHYHASIGAVTAAFMAAAYLLGEAVGLRFAGRERLVAVQPAIFGAGQAVFALGFAMAGAHGAARKVYGAEQHVRTALESAGLAVMGLGGLVAVVGGVLFLVLLVGAAGRRALPAGLSWRNSSWRSRTAPSAPSHS